MKTTSATVTEVRTAIDGFGSDHVILRRDHDGTTASMIVSHRDENARDNHRATVDLSLAQIDELIAGLGELRKGLLSSGRGGSSSYHHLSRDLMAERAGNLIGDTTPTYPTDVEPGDSVIVAIDGVEYYDQVREVQAEGKGVEFTFWRLGKHDVPADVRLPVRRG